MNFVAALGAGLFVLASLIVGGRLILLSRKTRGLPELMLGIGLFFMGGVGYPLMTILTRSAGLSDTTRSILLVAHMCTSLAGMGGLTWFTRRVFRPHDAWAGWLLLFIVGGFAGLALSQAFGPGLHSFIENPKSGPWSMKVFLGFVPMTWAGVESIRYARMQSKRLALGLADPIVTDRFRLWGVAILAADAITVAGVAFNLMGLSITSTPTGSLLIGSLGLITSGCLWLAFLPPQFYLDRAIARAGQQAAAPGA